MNTSMPETYNH